MLIKNYSTEKALERRKFHLEYKLTAEQIVVATKKAEKEFKKFQEDHQKQSGWRAWMPSMKSFWRGSSDSKDQSASTEDSKADEAGRDPQDLEIQRQLDLVLAKQE